MPGVVRAQGAELAVWLNAGSGPEGLALNLAFPACGSNATVTLPHVLSAAVRAAIEEAAPR
ncbi:hypothetical protein ACIBQ1_38170 [Nonomuraea sp. NPDC050153]|uniref:hypothetical protein n=1 Tax=Nonomuraea sp. NPDC050153 TaxID=3364359 RepID=UPI00378C3147